MPNLSFITDQSLYACVDALLLKANSAQKHAEKKFNKNVIDPFSPLFEMGGFNVAHDQWVKSYVYMDGIWLKQSWGGSVENVSILVAIGVNEDGYREIIGVREGRKEDAQSWENLLRNL